MPCHVPATSVSSRRRTLLPKRPPTIAAKLDLSKPSEAWAEEYLRRASTGNDAFWRPLSVSVGMLLRYSSRCAGSSARKSERFSVVTIRSPSTLFRGARSRLPKRP